jgi:phosphatidylethanolamine/phosphatidyl-N-methylethanolamine N-methyltransferase
MHNALVERAYDRLSHVYDFAFGEILQSGRKRAVREMWLKPGDSVLEVGVGTGLTLPLYPSNVFVVGLDFSEPMLTRAHRRLLQMPERAHIDLLRADAVRLPFDDSTFDIVYAPYVISAVADPVTVGRELRRVCRPSGRVILLNHFLSDGPVMSRVERALSPLTAYLGFASDLALPGLLSATGLRPVSIHAVNVPPIWKLVTCAPD